MPRCFRLDAPAAVKPQLGSQSNPETWLSSVWNISLGKKVIYSNVFPFELFTQAVAVLVWISGGKTFEKNLNYCLLLLRMFSAGSGSGVLQSPVKCWKL